MRKIIQLDSWDNVPDGARYLSSLMKNDEEQFYVKHYFIVGEEGNKTVATPVPVIDKCPTEYGCQHKECAPTD
jgi:hypothetical protein